MPHPPGRTTTGVRLAHRSSAGFTLVEVLVGMSLALMVMTAVLTTYTSLARNFTRTLGLSSATQPSIEAQARRALAYFAQDVQMASAISITPRSPPEFQVTFTLANGNGPKAVTYFYGTSTSISGHTVTAPARSLTRVVSEPNATNSFTTQTLLNNIIPTNDGCYIRFYDSSGRPYDNGTAPFTPVTTYPGMKQIALSFRQQAGDPAIGTQTQIYQTDSPRLIIRNKAPLL